MSKGIYIVKAEKSQTLKPRKYKAKWQKYNQPYCFDSTFGLQSMLPFKRVKLENQIFNI